MFYPESFLGRHVAVVKFSRVLKVANEMDPEVKRINTRATQSSSEVAAR